MHEQYKELLMSATTSSRGAKEVSEKTLFTLFDKYDPEKPYLGETTRYPVAPPILGEASVLSPSFIGEEKILIKSIPKFIGQDGTHPIYTAYNTLQGNQEAMEIAMKLGNQFNPNKGIYLSYAHLLGVELRKEEDGSEQAYLVLGQSSESADFPSAVIMRELPPHDSIEDLIQIGAIDLISNLLPEAFATLHNERTETLSYQQAKQWGSFDALQHKFLWNFQDYSDAIDILKNSSDIKIRETLQRTYNVYDEKQLRESLDEDLLFLKRLVVNFIFGKNNPFKRITKERIEKGFIKRIHGDPKAANLRFVTHPFIYGSSQSEHIIFLDHVDFKEQFQYGDIAEDWAHIKIDLSSLIREDFRSKFKQRTLPKMEHRYLKKSNQIMNPDTQALYKLHTLQKGIVRLNSKVKYKDQIEEGVVFLSEIMNNAAELLIQLKTM